ncbi:MAG TPA: glutathione S-transferase family protein [Polyangiaceae bacterium]|nr:glutathione S-transferase family protein [Polyangiaceae bacterium]
MTKPITLTYFDAPVSRGEECRLALHLAGLPFEDDRVKFADWPARKPTTPFGGLPVLTLPGEAPLAHSNAILTLIGRRHGLHPKDDLEAARHEALMQHCEDLRAHVGPTLRIKDEDEKRRAREQLAAVYLPAWAGYTEAHLGDGPFVGGPALNVVDLKLHMVVRWFKGGAVDYVPATVFDAFPKLTRVHDAVRDHAGVKAWYAR